MLDEHHMAFLMYILALRAFLTRYVAWLKMKRITPNGFYTAALFSCHILGSQARCLPREEDAVLWKSRLNIRLTI